MAAPTPVLDLCACARRATASWHGRPSTRSVDGLHSPHTPTPITPASTPSTESLFRLGLNDALPISDEATTSRVVVNNEILRTVIFTFDTGQLLTEHTSPRAVIVTLLEGEMDFSIGERTERMGAGDVVYLAPGERHALTAVSPCRMQLVMVDVDKAGTTATK